MKIYTKNGDTGETQIYTKDAIRVSKDDIILECYGTLDELNAHIGLLGHHLTNLTFADAAALLQANEAIQRELFALGFGISDSSQIDQEQITLLEALIDKLQATLPVQTHFILPGGSLAASQAHICRTVCRRCERVMVALAKQHPVDSKAIAYLNRLSDYLFVVARFLNHHSQISDIKV